MVDGHHGSAAACMTRRTEKKVVATKEKKLRKINSTCKDKLPPCAGMKLREADEWVGGWGGGVGGRLRLRGVAQGEHERQRVWHA